ncbi:acyl-CoA dehydrogenase family protein [Rhodopseudomonas sp. P2A-2r]|nr:acyl-CoA dehydrogenase family protein [Rhodopseudomonas sp. P2A-2r]UZE52322.1 acyl-CoA dehydrogenase family protein [Rhodopseudomonas sp. P2A-2r]
MQQPDAGGRSGHRRPRGALQAGRLGGEVERAEIHQLPCGVGAVEGERPGPENSIGKLVAGAMAQDIATFAMDLQGASGMLTDPAMAEVGGQFQAMLLQSPSIRIAGGTDEILRNIIAERVLGLPGDIRVDKDVPFNKIPTKGR